MHPTTALFFFALAVSAAPFTGPSICPTGLYSNPQCCATDVLGVADLDCAVPPTTPSDITPFIQTCSAIGQRARCCVIPVAGQAVLCQAVSPSGGGGGGGGASTPATSPTGGAPAPSPTGGASGGGGGASASSSSSSSCESSAAATSKVKPSATPTPTPTPSKAKPSPPPKASSTGCGC